MFSIDTYCDIATLKLTAIHAARAVLIIVIGRWLIRSVIRRMRKSLRTLCPESQVGIIAAIFTYIGYFILLVAILHEFDLNITALLGVAGIIGVATGYAAQTSVSNVIGGLSFMIEEPFQIGDTITVDGVEGTVIATNLFAVTLQKDNKLIRVPHCIVVRAVITKGKS